MYLVRKFYSPDPNEKGDLEKKEEQVSDEKSDSSNVELARALKEARENTVPKEKYEALEKENKRLVSEIINGDSGAGNGQQGAPEKADIGALRERLYGPKSSELTNLEFCKLTLELREAVMDQEGYDPFLPHGAKIKPSEQDTERAEAVAKVIKECIEKSEGNSEVFTALLQAEIANDSPSFIAHLKKIGAIK